MSSPTQHSLKIMRGRGYTCDVVEYWNSFTRTRKDLFGILDLLCIRDGEIVGVQTTSYANASARIRKIKESPLIHIILSSGIKVVVHGWRKVDNRWTVREVEINERTLDPNKD